MESAQLIKAFSATVQASLHGLQSIEPVLLKEQAALSGRDAEALEQVVAEKLALLKQLQNSVQARDRLLQSAGFSGGNDGGDKLVAALKIETLSEDWAALNALAHTVTELNDRNGQLAAQGQRATRTAIGILTGREESNDTYSTLKRGRSAVAGYSLGKV